jgi:ABC-type Fe3+/spermidine/putrescine transport system ATPase subunit
MTIALRLDGIRMRLGEKLVLDDLSLEIEAGESLALLGASGSGKTTALRVAAGLLRPEKGRVFLEGEDVTPAPPEARHMAMIHQRFLLFPHLTVEQNVAFGLPYLHGSRADQRSTVEKLISLVGLEGLERRLPHQLSGGQQQRVAIARALAVRPKLLLLDEPLNNLDSPIRERLLEELQSIQRSTHMTMLYVTHDQGEAARIAGRVALLEEGRVLQAAAYEELLDRPTSVQAARVLGLRNLFRAERWNGAAGVPALGLRLPQLRPLEREYVVYLPPGRLQLRCPGDGWMCLSGLVEEIIPGPMASRVRVSREGVLLEALSTRSALSEAHIRPGSMLDLWLNPEEVRLIPGVLD